MSAVVIILVIVVFLVIVCWVWGKYDKYIKEPAKLVRNRRLVEEAFGPNAFGGKLGEPQLPLKSHFFRGWIERVANELAANEEDIYNTQDVKMGILTNRFGPPFNEIQENTRQRQLTPSGARGQWDDHRRFLIPGLELSEFELKEKNPGKDLNKSEYTDYSKDPTEEFDAEPTILPLHMRGFELQHQQIKMGLKVSKWTGLPLDGKPQKDYSYYFGYQNYNGEQPGCLGMSGDPGNFVVANSTPEYQQQSNINNNSNNNFSPPPPSDDGPVVLDFRSSAKASMS